MEAPPPYPGPMGEVGPRYGRRRRLLGVFVAVGVAIVAVGALLLVVSLDPQAFGLWHRSFFPFGGGFLGAFLILWGILLLVRIGLRAGRRPGYGAGPGRARPFDPAIMEARRRYARGEITREQFEQIVTDLRRPRGPPP